MVIRVHWVHSGESLAWSDSFGFVGFVWARTSGCRDHSRSFRSVADAMMVVEFFWLSWVYILARTGCRRLHSRWYGSFWRAWGSSSFFAFVGFIQARSRGRLVYFDSSGSLGRALGVVGFIPVHWVLMRPGRDRVHLGSLRLFRRALGFVGLIGVDWVHYDASWVSSGSLLFVWFIRCAP